VCREILEKDFTPSQLRLMFAMQPWNKEMNFVFAAKRGLQKKENAFKFFFQNIDVLLAKEPCNLKMEVHPAVQNPKVQAKSCSGAKDDVSDGGDGDG